MSNLGTFLPVGRICRAALGYDEGVRNIVRTNVHLRLPKALHERAAEVAVEQDVSLNGLLVALIADKLGYDVVIPAAPAQDAQSATGGTFPTVAQAQSPAGGTTADSAVPITPAEANTASLLLDTAVDALAQLRALVEAVPEAT